MDGGHLLWNVLSVKTMFLIAAGAFAASALAWFFTWAICVHSVASVYGPGPANMEPCMPPGEAARLQHARQWVRRLRTLTLILFVGAAITAGIALYSSEA